MGVLLYFVSDIGVNKADASAKQVLLEFRAGDTSCPAEVLYFPCIRLLVSISPPTQNLTDFVTAHRFSLVLSNFVWWNPRKQYKLFNDVF